MGSPILRYTSSCAASGWINGFPRAPPRTSRLLQTTHFFVLESISPDGFVDSFFVLFLNLRGSGQGKPKTVSDPSCRSFSLPLWALAGQTQKCLLGERWQARNKTCLGCDLSQSVTVVVPVGDTCWPRLGHTSRNGEHHPLAVAAPVPVADSACGRARRQWRTPSVNTNNR